MGEPRGSNYRECVEAAINAGIDMVMVPYKYEKFINELTSLVKDGKILMSRIDDAVERILRLKFTAGLFEHPFSDRSLLKFVGCKVDSAYDFSHNLTLSNHKIECYAHRNTER